MNSELTTARLAALTLAITLGAGPIGAARAGDAARNGDIVITATAVDPAVLAAAEREQEQQLRRSLHQMRQIIEQEAAQAAANARGNTAGLYINPSDSPSVGALREQLARSMERLEDRCFGLEAKAENGNVIVICGDNAGTAENANVRNSADTTLVMAAPAASEAVAPETQGRP